MTEQAQQPKAAPRGKVVRGGIPIGLVATAVVLALVAVAVVRFVGSQPTAPLSAASNSASATVPGESPSASATPQATATEATPQPTSTVLLTPTATSIVAGTPRPGDESTAVALVTRYQTLISQAKYADAWALLSPESKASWPYADFEQSWAATAKSWGTAFTLGTPTHDWRSWDPGLPTMYAGDYGRAYLIRVDYPGQVNTNGWDMLLVMPSLSGDWEISIAR